MKTHINKPQIEANDTQRGISITRKAGPKIEPLPMQLSAWRLAEDEGAGGPMIWMDEYPAIADIPVGSIGEMAAKHLRKLRGYDLTMAARMGLIADGMGTLAAEFESNKLRRIHLMFDFNGMTLNEMVDAIEKINVQPAKACRGQSRGA